jgi:aspartate carbamoyltransferase catalytic subunit
MPSQQEFLRDAADALGLTQKELAARMCAPWETFRKWLLPQESGGAREMPEIAWQLVREILENEKLKKKVK